MGLPIIQCNLGALSAAEQQDRERLALSLSMMTGDSTQLSNGVQLRFGPDRAYRETIEKLAILERRCCSFLEIQIQDEAPGFMVQITGPPGTKDFLAAEFGI